LRRYPFIPVISLLLFLLTVLSASGQTHIPSIDTVFNQTDARGKKQGYWKKYYPDGKIFYRGFFRDGTPVGEFKRYYDNGTLKSMLYYHPQDDTVDVTYYYMNGKLAAQGYYVNKKREGDWNYYSFYEDFLSYVEHYANGKKHGTSTKYYNTGDVAEILEWSNGLKNGKWLQFFPDGTPMVKATYLHGKLEGHYTVYYVNGKKQIEGTYKHDLRDGEWHIFDKTGNQTKTMHYTNGIAANEDEITMEQNALLDSLERNKGKFKDPEKYGIDIFKKR